MVFSPFPANNPIMEGQEDNSLVNLSERQRAVSAIAGSLLLYFTMKKNKSAALLGLAGGFLLYRGLSGHCALSALKDRHLAATGRNINVRTHVLVNRPRQEVYRFWRKLENLNLFMQHVESIRETGDKGSSWKIKIPGVPGSPWNGRRRSSRKRKERRYPGSRGPARPSKMRARSIFPIRRDRVRPVSMR